MSARHSRSHGDDQLSLVPDVPLIHAIREPVTARLAERMRAREDLVEDDAERPHVDLGRVGVGSAGAASHLRCDIWERTDLRLQAVVFEVPFGVVEVAEFNTNREDGGNQDVLAALVLAGVTMLSE